MSQPANPAMKAFAAEIKNELILAQVLVRRAERGFEMRHVKDRLAEDATLRCISLNQAREISQFTATGAFRPLKSSPNLQTGWRLAASNETELESALNQFYPNAIADWFLVHSGKPPITNFREFTSRQSGMYRITAMLDDTQAACVIRACCDAKFCLKRRLWSVAGLAPDGGTHQKSLIPCLEPCAILLEFSRKAMRIEQEEKTPVPLSPSDAATLEAALRIALEHPLPEVREADFNSPANPRRIQLALERLRATGIKLANEPTED